MLSEYGLRSKTSIEIYNIINNSHATFPIGGYTCIGGSKSMLWGKYNNSKDGQFKLFHFIEGVDMFGNPVYRIESWRDCIDGFVTADEGNYIYSLLKKEGFRKLSREKYERMV